MRRLWLILCLLALAVQAHAIDAFTNSRAVTVSTGYDASATTIVLTTGEGAAAGLPTTAANYSWWNASDYGAPDLDPSWEIIRCTRSTDTLTCSRAAEAANGATTAFTHNTAGRTYKLLETLTAKTLNTDIGQDVNTTSTPTFAGATLTGAALITVNGIAASDTDAFTVQNTTASTGAVTVQQSPWIRWRSSAWNGSTAANWASDWYVESVPTTGGPPVGFLTIKSVLNGTTTTAAQFTSAGNVLVGPGATNPQLMFGGSTASFVMLKRAGTQVQIRLANDGGDGDLRVGNLTIAGTSLTLPTSVFLTGTFIANSSNAFDLAQSTAPMRSLYAQTSFSLGSSAARVIFTPPGDGLLALTNAAATIGAELKVDALPTVSSGFGAGAAITTGSTPLAGSIAVGTTAGTGGVIAFNGTAYPSAPFVVCMNSTTTQAIRCTANTTTLTVTSAALTDNDVVMWHAISSK